MAKKMVNKLPLDQRVLGFIRQHKLVAEGQTLLVAVSGGQDSVCLLHILYNLQSELGIKLYVAHLNHQLRGTESDEDARYVAKLAKSLSIPATIEKRDVTSYQKEHGISLEEAAREVRYNFLAEVAAATGADGTAVGHTLNDHIETILLHLVRGTGTRGLRGLQPVTRWRAAERELTVIRPLLEVRREETADYCANRQLQPRQDSTNLSLAPLRNRVRLELLPLLQKYNLQVIEALRRNAQIAADDIAHLEKEADRLFKKVAVKQGEIVILDRKALTRLSASMQRYVLRLAIEKTAGNLKDIEARHIEELMQALRKPAGKQISLPYGLIFTIDYDRYLLSKGRAAPPLFPALTGEYSLKIPGKTVISGWRVLASILEPEEPTVEDSEFVAHFDYNQTGEKLMVRPRRGGDRFQPSGMNGTKTVGQFMLDVKIPRAWRGSIPLVTSGDRILWVTGYRIDERVKVTEKTKKVLCLQFKQV
jgi:tRNA(Ile)-lysidine synthase